MKINQINEINFKAKIIDAHCHIGSWQGRTYGTDSLDCFIKTPLNIISDGEKSTDTIEKMLVSNLDGIDKKGALADEIKANEIMIEISKNNPKICPLIVCQPNITNGDTKNIKYLIQKSNSFAGLKFHPKSLELRADDIAYDSYLDLAKEKNLPCLFHSQVNLDWSKNAQGKSVATLADVLDNSDPRLVYNLAKRHPEVSVILAHCGAGGEIAHNIAIDTLLESIEKNDAKLYCDISWVDFLNDAPSDDPKSVIKLIKKLKEKNALSRIMFGTDAPLGCYDSKTGFLNDTNKAKQMYEQTVSKLKSAIKKEFKDESDEIIQKIFYDNANDLFFNNKESNNNIAGNLSRNLKSKIPFAALGAALFCIGITAIGLIHLKHLKNKAKDSNKTSKPNENKNVSYTFLKPNFNEFKNNSTKI